MNSLEDLKAKIDSREPSIYNLILAIFYHLTQRGVSMVPANPSTWSRVFLSFTNRGVKIIDELNFDISSINPTCNEVYDALFYAGLSDLFVPHLYFGVDCAWIAKSDLCKKSFDKFGEKEREELIPEMAEQIKNSVDKRAFR